VPIVDTYAFESPY